MTTIRLLRDVTCGEHMLCKGDLLQGERSGVATVIADVVPGVRVSLVLGEAAEVVPVPAEGLPAIRMLQDVTAAGGYTAKKGDVLRAVAVLGDVVEVESLPGHVVGLVLGVDAEIIEGGVVPPIAWDLDPPLTGGGPMVSANICEGSVGERHGVDGQRAPYVDGHPKPYSVPDMLHREPDIHVVSVHPTGEHCGAMIHSPPGSTVSITEDGGKTWFCVWPREEP